MTWPKCSVYSYVGNIYLIIALEYILTSNTVGFRRIYEIVVVKNNKNHKLLNHNAIWL
jgi:hypothetical protein